MITPIAPGLQPPPQPTNPNLPMIAPVAPGGITATTLPALPAVDAQGKPPVDKTLVNSLASFVRGQWERAKQEKISSGIEERMIRAKQARALEYDAQKKAEIATLHGATWEPPYMPVIETKCRALEDWIMDVYFQPGTRPFGIENTPDPDMPPEIEQMVRTAFGQKIEQEIRQTTGKQIAQMVAQKHTSQGSYDVNAMDSEVEDYVGQQVQAALQQRSEAVHQQIKQVAKDLTEKFEIKVDDKLKEGGWYQALREMVRDIATFPSAFIKGPEERMTIKRSRQYNPSTGKYVTAFDEVAQEKFTRVSPINIYPLVGARTCQDGLIEKTKYSPMELQDMIGIDGFAEAELRAVLQEARNGNLREWTSIDSRIALLDNKSTNSIYMGDNVDALIYWGQAPGKELVEWGMNRKSEVITDLDKWYRVYCMLIGTHVVMARLNPNPDGKINYYKASFIEDADKFWGQAIPDILWGHQVTANAVFRACGINAAMASGPIIEQDIERCPDQGPLHPFKRFYVTSDQMKSNSPALRLYNIQLVVLELSRFYDFLMTLCDFDSGVPRFAHGGEASQGIDTASGQAMQLSQSSRGTKACIEHIDRGVTEPSVEAEAYYIMDHDQSAEPPAGDMKISAKGSSALVVKEQATLRLNEFLARTNNPVDTQIIGADGRRQMLRDVMKSLPLDRDKILPEEQQMIDQTLGTDQTTGASQPASGAPQQPILPEGMMSPSGNLPAGRDFATFQPAGV